MKYEVKGPDGTVYDVEGPEGATDEQILAQVRQFPRIKANVGSMIDQGATEAEIDRYLASEGATAQDLQSGPKKLSSEDEKAYVSLAQNPKTTAADLKGFAKDHGITIRDSDIAGFLQARDKGSRVAKKVIYENLPKPPPASLAQNIGAAVGRAVDGVIPGLARTDRGVHGVVNNALGALTGSEDFDPSHAFQQGKDEQDMAQARFGVEHPDMDTAAALAGLAGGFALPEAKVFKGAGLLKGMGNAALTGVGYGALSGALNETGGGNLENAALGGLFGGFLGAAAPPVLHGAAALGSSVRRNVPGTDATARFLANLPRRAFKQPLEQPGDAARAQAERLLAQELEGGTIMTGMGTGTVPSTPANIADEVARRQAMGVPAMPADVSEPGRRVTAWALRGNGPAATRARNLLVARQDQQGQRIRGHITEELGPAVDPIQAVDDINRRASSAARSGYEAAYAQPMLITPEIGQIMGTPAFRDALPQAFDNIRNGMGDPHAMGFRTIPDTPNALPPDLPHFRASDGSLVVADPKTLSVEAFDQVARAMGDAGRAAMDTSGFRPRNTTNSVHINARANDLRRHLGDQNEAYRDVTANYADEMALRDALEQGQGVAKLSGHEINAQARDMPGHAQEAWMTGARTALADDATKVGLRPTVNVAQRTRQSLGLSGAGQEAALGDQTKQQAIEALSGRPGAIQRIDDRLEAESQAFQTFKDAAASVSAWPSHEQMDARELGGKVINVAGKALKGRFVSAASELAHGSPNGVLKFRQDLADHQAALMTATDSGSVADAMHAIMSRAQKDADFAHALNKAGIKPSKIAAAYAAALDADAVPEDPAITGPAYTMARPAPAGAHR